MLEDVSEISGVKGVAIVHSLLSVTSAPECKPVKAAAARRSGGRGRSGQQHRDRA
jgi:hypothetical protein